MASDVTLRAVLTGSAKGLLSAFEEAAAAADATGKEMADSMGAAGSRVSSDLDKAGKDGESFGESMAGSLGGVGKDAEKAADDVEEHGSRIGSVFSKLGNAASNMGIPFANSLSEMGEKMESTESKGSSFFSKLSNAGGLAFAGLAAGAIGFGAESLEMADKFDAAQTNLKVAIKNTGDSFDNWKGPISQAYTQMAQLGFNSTDTATALTSLTTSVGDLPDALNMMGTAADLARFKHISLAAASQLLAKAIGGSNRVLTQMGINIDIGSGKLSSIQTATDSLATAQLHLKQTQQEVAAKVLTGVKAEIALENAHRAVSLASQKLTLDQQTVGKVIDAITQKTQGAAKAYGQTLPGQMDIARAEIHNLGTDFGMWLEPKILDVVKAVTSAVNWLEKHTVVAKILAGVIGGVLAIAIGAFAINMTAKFVKAIQSVLHPMDAFKNALKGNAEQTQETADVQTEASAQSAEAIESQATATEAAADSIQQSMFDIQDANEATAAVQTETAEVSEATGGGLGPIGMILGAVMIVVTLMVTHWKQTKEVLSAIWHGISDDAVAVWHGIEGFLKAVWQAIKVVFEDATIVGLLLGHWKQIESDAVAVWHDVMSFLEGIPGDILHVFSSAGSWLLNVGKDIVGGLWTGIKDWWAINVTIPAHWAGDILKEIGDAGTWLYDAGKNLVLGLWHGIDDSWHVLITNLENAFKRSLVGKVLGWLGITSPSKVFAGIGMHVMEGMAVGINANAGLVSNAIGRVAVDLTSSKFTAPGVAAAGAIGTSASAPGAVSASGSRQISVVQNFTGIVNPHDLAVMASKEVAWALKTADV